MIAAAKWSLISDRRAPDEWWASWQALADAHCGGHPLLSAVMVRQLVEHFAEGPLEFATLAAGGRALAQTILNPRSWGRSSVFAPSQAPLGLSVFDPSVDGAAALRLLMAAAPGTRLAISLPYQDEPFSWLRGAADGPVRRESLGTTISVCGQESFDQYWSARSRDLRQNVRRYLKRAEQDGLKPVLRTITDPTDIAAAVDRFGLLESAGWKGSEGTALHPDNEQGRFYRDMLTQLAASGRATAFELHMGPQLAASRLMISGPAMHVMLKTTYLEDLKRFAPGRILLYLTLEQLLAEKSPRAVEFYTRANEDMLQWATHTREMSNVTLYRAVGIANLADFKARLRRPRASSG